MRTPAEFAEEFLKLRKQSEAAIGTAKAAIERAEAVIARTRSVLARIRHPRMPVQSDYDVH